ncbi:hypothetical protein FAGAP_2738 [Fusarium agapanthi]|uniref:DUF1593-domain-containing protein n=1 Tax=Fusarium agapanthi TaxID=1803897 RepID=A0A9P5BLT6_9HYPO|nr:hypothetical protein FAGAP_2738 [Fusarium agapanthi]
MDLDTSAALNYTMPNMFSQLVGAFALFTSLPFAQAAPSHDKQCLTARTENKRRLFVLTDISNEPHDQMSLVRLLTYANEIDIQGISVTTSAWMPDKIDYDEYTVAAWNGISGEEYRNFDHGGPDSSIVSNDWLEKNIRLGPLGSHCLNWSFIMEGDTPAFLPLVQNGLGDSRVYADTSYYVVGANGKAFTSKFATIWRWHQDYQFDSENNHQPVSIVNGSCGTAPLKLKYKPGNSVVLDASDSGDPDGDELKFDWFHYREPGGAYGRGFEGFDPSLTMKPILTPKSPNVNITSIKDDRSIVKLETAKSLNDTMHIILALRDATEKPLATYRRIILEAK